MFSGRGRSTDVRRLQLLARRPVFGNGDCPLSRLGVSDQGAGNEAIGVGELRAQSPSLAITQDHTVRATDAKATAF
jgi:hypothetical protein